MIGTGVFVVVVVLVFARLAYGIILPPMRDGLGLSYRQAGTLGTITALGYLLLVMVAGNFAGRYGGRRAVLLGLALSLLSFIGLALASNYYLLMVLFALAGMGTAFGYTPLVSLVASWFPERSGTVIGLLGSGVGIGMFIVGALIPYLSQVVGESGWRIAWALFAVVAVVVMLVSLAVLRDPPLFASGAAPRPVDRAAVFRNRRLITVGLVYGVIGMSYIVQAIFMYSFAVDAGVAPLTAGRQAALMGLLSIFASPFWGWLSDRIGRGNSLLTAMSCAIIGMALPLLWPTVAGFAIHYMIIGSTMSGLFTAVLSAAVDQVEPREAPLAVSFITVFFAAGQFIGPAVAGQLVAWSGSLQAPFVFTCAVMVLGLYLSSRVRRFAKRPSRIFVSVDAGQISESH